MKKALIIVSLVLLMSIFCLPASAANDEAKPLDEIFNDTVVIPYDYHNQFFAGGLLGYTKENYKLYMRDQRVLVPVRLVTNLLGSYSSQWDWQASWQPDKPDDVAIWSTKAQITVKLKAGSDTMYVNNKAVKIDVPAQMIEGRIVLPLRAIGEAVDKHIAWVDGLVVLSNTPLDLQAETTKTAITKCKSRLADDHLTISWTKVMNPLYSYNDIIYYTKNTDHDAQLWMYKDGQSRQINLPGHTFLARTQIFDDIVDRQMYYTTNIDGNDWLCVFDFTNNTATKICALSGEGIAGGWLAQVKKIEGQIYVALHHGDLTMGNESLYLLQDGSLKKLITAKSFINFDIVADKLYYTDFSPVDDFKNNLYCVDLKTGEKTMIGAEGYIYDIRREMDESSISYTGNPYTIKNGYLYCLAFPAVAESDICQVAKLNLADNQLTMLPIKADVFWLADDYIYYTDGENGSLMSCDLEGAKQQVLVDQMISAVTFTQDYIYYTLKDHDHNILPGIYKYDIAQGQKSQIRHNTVLNNTAQKLIANNNGVYYIADGYNPGLFKISDEQEICLTDNYLDSYVDTGNHIVYNLTYQEGIYQTK